ncbi:MAG: DUF5716 family protein [Candidatus Kaistia colombiensis]|nr:MAG: DUF5716 family protein [Kaistia sp.]
MAHLADDPFGHAGEVATRKRVFDSVAEFIDRRGRAEVVEALTSEGTCYAPGQSYVAAYNRLVETGWLVEYRDRYRRVVDFDPAARLVLHTLLDIQKGRVRSYGGAVLNVLTLLQSVEDDRFKRALNVREAALSARGFMNHLRTVAGTMRRVEALIMAQPTAAALVRRFVTDFIESLVVQDYRNLHARESPYRFRGKILETGESLLADDKAIDEIAYGWVSGGIAKDAASARDPIIADLREIIRVFAGIDDHVQDIETTTFRIERRMTNVVRFSDRMATVSTDRILRAMELMRGARLVEDDEVEVRTRLQLATLPISAKQFYMLPRRRAEVPEREIELQAPDPALLAYMAALDEFESRVTITPERLERYVEATLAGAAEAPAAAFQVHDVEQFLLFERLHEVGLGELSERYELESVDGVVANGWVERQAFVLRRREAAHG